MTKYSFQNRKRFYDNTDKISTRIVVSTQLSKDDLYVTLQKDYPTKDLYIEGSTDDGNIIVIFAGTVPLTKEEKELKELNKLINLF